MDGGWMEGSLSTPAPSLFPTPVNLIKAVHFSFITFLPMHSPPPPPSNFNTPSSFLVRLKLLRIITVPEASNGSDWNDRARFINFKPRLLIYPFSLKLHFIFLENNVKYLLGK